ncbi:MAG TPA: hypothetical protein PLX33_12005 [Alphaproteobacteria bacterium]|nr:hypothetical protein [Alphaproteobacteria bacterium]
MTKNNLLSFAVVLFIGLGLGFTANFAHAQTEPGCPPEAKEAADNHAEVKRVEGNAHAKQNTPQNDNAPGMTCFDHAMALTARLGGIFSDVTPTNVPAAVESVFGTSSFPDFGASTKLVKGLNAVVTPTVQEHAINFTDSLSQALGATVMGYVNAFVSDVIDPILNSIAGPLATLNGYVADLNSYYSILNTALTLLGVSTPAVIQAAVTAINSAWTTINNFISTAVSTIVNTINSIVQTVTDAITSAVTSLVSAAVPEGECSRISQLWGNDFPPDFRSLIGSAVERGTPYFTMYQMLEGGIPTTFGEPGARLLTEIFSDANATTLQNALDDLLPGGVLSGPGSMPSWGAVPTIDPLATIEDLVGQM